MRSQAVRHPKMRRIQTQLKLPLWQAVGLLETLWQFAAEYAIDGKLGRWTAEEVADWLEYEGDPEELLEALVSCGWLDRIDGDLVIHDWASNCPDYVKKRIQRQPVADNGGQRRTTAASGSQRRPTQPNPTQRNPTKREGGSRFAPPSLVEVRDYAKEKGLTMDPEAFVDHYASNGWKVSGKSPMKDWKAAARNWARRQSQFTNGQPEERTGKQVASEWAEKLAKKRAAETPEERAAWERRQEQACKANGRQRE